MEVSSSFWIGFIILVIALLSLDMFLFNRKGTVIDVKRALWLSLFWISLAFIFNVGVYMVFGKESALEFFTAYLVEESLSIDNLFVFIIIFSAFKIKPEHQHTVLFWGILGAIVFRAIFIFAGVALIERFAWIMYLFGVFLLFTGGKMMFDELNLLDREKVDEPKDPNSNGVVKIFRRLFPVHEDMSEPVFFRRIDRKLYATPFFLALLVIEFTDLIFAIDSIPAVLSISTNTFIVYTSNIFAILGLRSLYFALRGIMDLFHFLKYALSGILIFIGFKMIFNHYAHTADWDFHISNLSSLLVIASFLLVSIAASLIWSGKQRSMKREGARLRKRVF
ncbi:tellurite resistance protein TerC [Porphyromonadaceae bacterium KHP3R9]|nr:tellurite resistance protein TerC [Porphyromonadaceae bacterium KHP3R9]